MRDTVEPGDAMIEVPHLFSDDDNGLVAGEKVPQEFQIGAC